MNELIDLMLKLSQEIKTIKAYLEVFQKTRVEKFNEAWIDGQDVMQVLHISKRTLQSLRDSGVLPYSRLNGKFYYKLSDIENILESNYSILKSGSHGN
ncbi:helix-turn-helix domain-containing protein [Lentimicrobium sp. L6]|uniref:helix-turn-helix domain-containing protein n=1 Tax=Lentimicrobium sp. L6 TaxID=2735916 RepID=UPI001551B010|nr:helix-turn-helix domain-containing protein [Lentimicrobium sp. L6]NPD86439.1 helix-turn-helix domain-containing protein [Lentimicrobium sp. L6]